MALLHRRLIIALCGAILAVVLAPAAALTAGGPGVTIRIEGLNKTLVLPTEVRVPGGFITRFGAPANKCSASSAQGALNVASHGKWAGTWYSSYNEYLITSILGERPKGSDYWEIFVNDKAASVGACDLKARPGEQVLFADTSGSEGPAELIGPHSAVAGRPFTVKLVGYTAAGKAKPLAGALVTGNGIKSVNTNSRGIATLLGARAGVLVLRAGPKGYVRTEAVVHVAA